MSHNTPSVAFGPEMDLTDYAPVLAAEIEEIHNLLPRIPRQATYQTLTLAPGQIVRLLGFDASRQRAVVSVTATDTDIAVVGIDVSAIDSWVPDVPNTAATGGFIVPAGNPLILANQASLYAVAPGTNAAAVTVSVLVESHAIS